MSLYYGYDGEQGGVLIPRSNDFFTTFTYAALSTSSWAIPQDLKTGHPTPIPYVGKYITEDTTLTIMEHTFDKDGTISNLVVEYLLVIYEKDGTTFGHSLGNFEISTNMLPLTTRYISVVNKTFKLSDYHQNWKDIAVIYVKVKKVSGAIAGNESAMTARITY